MMGILGSLREQARRLQRAGESYVAQRLHGEALSLSAEIPGSRGAPLWQMQLEMRSEPQADGERLKLRAHLRLNLGPPALAGPPGQASMAPALPARVGRWIERGLAAPVIRTLAAPLLQRELNTWIELQASNAALDAGSKALLPEKLETLGIRPGDRGPVETWAGALPGPRGGFAAMTLLRMDKRGLPAALQRAFGPKPFQMSAAVVHVIEEN